jgi:hypothetical protein
LTASGVTGRAYQLFGTTNLAQPNWLNIGGAVTASNTIFDVSDILPLNRQEFYKLEFETP